MDIKQVFSFTVVDRYILYVDKEIENVKSIVFSRLNSKMNGYFSGFNCNIATIVTMSIARWFLEMRGFYYSGRSVLG